MAEKDTFRIATGGTVRKVSFGSKETQRDVTGKEFAEEVGRRLRGRPHIGVDEIGIRTSSTGGADATAKIEETQPSRRWGSRAKATRISAFVEDNGTGHGEVEIARGQDEVTRLAADHSMASGNGGNFLSRAFEGILGPVINRVTSPALMRATQGFEEGQKADRIDRGRVKAYQRWEQRVREENPDAVILSRPPRPHAVREELNRRYAEQHLIETHGTGWSPSPEIIEDRHGVRLETHFATGEAKTAYDAENEWNNRAAGVEGNSRDFGSQTYNIVRYVDNQIVDVEWGDRREIPSDGGITYEIGGQQVSEQDFTSWNE